MAFSLSSPVTGGAQTGLTSPTYTLVADSPPVPHSKQWYVSALGGTQTGVDVHQLSKPFTIAVFKPASAKALPVMNQNGVIYNIPNNTTKVVTRKGVLPLAGQPNKNLLITTVIECPAGADLADPEDIRAAMSLHIGALNQQSAGLGDSAIQGTI